MQIIVPCVARFVMQPTALHWTSTFGLPIWRMSCSRPPSLTIKSLFSAVASHQFVCWQSPLSTRNLLLTAKLPNAALAARCTSTSCDCSRNRMGFNVSRPTCRTSEEYASIRTAVSFSPPPHLSNHLSLWFLQKPALLIAANQRYPRRLVSIMLAKVLPQRSFCGCGLFVFCKLYIVPPIDR